MFIYRRWFVALTLLLLFISAPFVHAATNSVDAQAVYVIPVKQTIESGLHSFLERAITEANESGAQHIILDIDTLGGRLDSAEEIGELIRSNPIPTVAFVSGKAVSAGSYIALNANKIVMTPGSSIGAAAVVDGSGNEIDNPKIVAHWASVMRGAAELRGRDPNIAEKMSNKHAELSLPQLNKSLTTGQILSLTADEALKVGYADKIAADLDGVLDFIGKPNSELVDVQPSFAEKLARWLTNPNVMMLLFLIGIAGVGIELFVPGFGIPGGLGVTAFGLYFFGHYIAGFAGVEDMIFFLLGIVLLIIELFVPSFGILGIAGIISIISGVVMAAYDTENALRSLGIASLLAIVIIAIFIKYFKHRGIWNKFILQESLTSEAGFNSHESKTFLVGKQGVSVTPLRPSGTVVIDDTRIDVVTDGEFIAIARNVQVVKVEGTRVVVKEIM